MELSAFHNLFGDLQKYVSDILNADEILQKMGAVFIEESSLDIEYQIKDALNRQGLACVVMTPKATYQGHNGIQQTFTCDELTIQIVENPIINRARLKKAGLEHGTALDVAKQASDRLAGPQGGYFGQFTTKRIQEAEQGGLLVCTATFGCTVYEKLDAVISGDLSGKWVEVPFVRTSELSDYIDDYLSTHMPEPVVSGYLPLSGGTMEGMLDLSVQPLRLGSWELYDDLAGTGLSVYDTDTGESYQFGGAESDFQVARKMDLTGQVDVPTKLSELSNDVGFVTSADVVMRDNTSPLTVTVPYDYGFTLQTPNGTPLIQTIDLNRTAMVRLSAGDIETAGTAKHFTGQTGTVPLSAWNWLMTDQTGLGDVISGQHDGILAEVAEDYASYIWINQQNFVKDADLSGAWKKTDTQLSVGTGTYKTYVDPGAVTIQRLLNSTLTKTMQNWDGFTYTVSAEGGTPTNYNFTYPLSGGVIATRQYVDAYLGDIESLIDIL